MADQFRVMSIVLIWVLSTIRAAASNGPPEHIFLLAGQSNMVGHGGMETGSWDENVPPECSPSPKIFRLDAQLVWAEAKEPIHEGIYPRIQPVTGVGPSMPFARHVLNLSPNFGTIGLVPCACDWTSMDDWIPEKDLYKNMIVRAKASVSTGGKIAALLWWQGGRDAYKKEEADAYRGKLEKFLPQVRIDLGMPDLPILMILLPEGGEAKFTGIVRNAQQSITLPRLIKIDLPKLPLQHDRKHLTTAGQVLVGTKLAEAFCAAGFC